MFGDLTFRFHYCIKRSVFNYIWWWVITTGMEHIFSGQILNKSNSNYEIFSDHPSWNLFCLGLTLRNLFSVINTRKTKSDWSIKEERLWLILFIDWFFLLEGASKYVWFYYQYSTSVIWTMYLHIKLGHLKAPDAQKSQKCVFLLYWHQRIIVQYLGISYIKLLSCYHDILGGT